MYRTLPSILITGVERMFSPPVLALVHLCDPSEVANAMIASPLLAYNVFPHGLSTTPHFEYFE